MRKFFVCFGVLLLSAGVLSAETTLEVIDRMHEEELHQENQTFIQEVIESATDPIEESELYWRLARTTHELGDLLVEAGADEEAVLNTYLEGEGYADKAIELNPESYWAVYWKSANMGKWGETKGLLKALFKAKPIRDLLHQALSIYPGHPDSYYVLGILYRKVPGKPISFGSSDKAVSLARKSIDTHRAEYEAGMAIKEYKLVFYMELARSLWDRGWSAKGREKKARSKAERFESVTDVLEKAFNYEGTIDIPDVSDREEAVDVMSWVVSEFRAKPTLKEYQQVYLEEALADLENWTN